MAKLGDVVRSVRAMWDRAEIKEWLYSSLSKYGVTSFVHLFLDGRLALELGL